MSNLEIAVASAMEATRPKTSGPSVNAHVVKSQPCVPVDFDKMQQQILGSKEKAANFERERS